MTRGSLPNLRSELVGGENSGDSTESLIDEAEDYLRRSIDSMLTISSASTDYWSKQTAKRRRARRHSEPDLIRDWHPPQDARPYLPKVHRSIYYGHTSTNQFVQCRNVHIVVSLLDTKRSQARSSREGHITGRQGSSGSCEIYRFCPRPWRSTCGRRTPISQRFIRWYISRQKVLRVVSLQIYQFALIHIYFILHLAFLPISPWNSVDLIVSLSLDFDKN